MSGHPIDRIREALELAAAASGRGSIARSAENALASLHAFEQLEQAARNLDGYANDESGPYVLVRLDELRALTAALALFDRKEQTP